MSQAAEVVTGTTVATDSSGHLFLFTPVAFPETVRAGDAGVTGNGTQFNSNCTPTILGSKITGAYSVASDSANSLLVTMVRDKKDVGSGETQSSTVYRIDTNGNVSPVSITTTKSFLGSVYQTFVFTF